MTYARDVNLNMSLALCCDLPGDDITRRRLIHQAVDIMDEIHVPPGFSRVQARKLALPIYTRAVNRSHRLDINVNEYLSFIMTLMADILEPSSSATFQLVGSPTPLLRSHLGVDEEAEFLEVFADKTMKLIDAMMPLAAKDD